MLASERCNGQQQQNDRESREEREAALLEASHVHEVYEVIAPHFSSTRHSPWPLVAEFIESLPAGTIVADVGCGNGKYLRCAPKGVHMIGLDRSVGLTSIAAEIGAPVCVADGLSLPLRDNSVDVIVSIAVVHHWASEQRRRAAMIELARVLRPGGQMLVYVWALEQQDGSSYGRKFEKQDVMVPWKLQQPKGANLSEEERLAREEEKRRKGKEKAAAKKAKKAAEKAARQGMTADDKEHALPTSNLASADGSKNNSSEGAAPNAAPVLQRFYHVFAAGELECLVDGVAGLHVERSFFDHANWCVVARKDAATPAAFMPIREGGLGLPCH